MRKRIVKTVATGLTAAALLAGSINREQEPIKPLKVIAHDVQLYRDAYDDGYGPGPRAGILRLGQVALPFCVSMSADPYQAMVGVEYTDNNNQIRKGYGRMYSSTSMQEGTPVQIFDRAPNVLMGLIEFCPIE